MAHVSSRRSESCWARRPPLALRAATLLWAVAACADLFDIPAHPRVVNESVVSPVDSPSEGPSSRGAEASGGDEPTVMTSATSEAPPGPVPLDVGDALVSSGAAGDAGAVDAAAGDNSATPPPNDASPTLGCAAPERLGPNDRCYATVATLLSWFDARQTCQSLGDAWDLAAIRDDRVNQFLAALLTSEAWIGASDRGTEGTWVWVDDGVTFWSGSADAGSATNGAYVNWNEAEPNNLNNSDCARIQPGMAGRWADLDCAALRSAVCAGPLH
jgi:hypothetical protein